MPRVPKKLISDRALRRRAYKAFDKALEKVFKRGPERYSEEELASFIHEARRGKRLYRYDAAPEELVERGWDLNRKRRRVGLSKKYGLFWTPRKANIPSFVKYEAFEPNVIGIKRPGARVIKLPYLAEEKVRGYDFQDTGGEILREVIQLGPNQVLAEIRLPSGKKVYRLIGLGAAAAGGTGTMGLFGEDQAYAMPPGIFKKISSKTALEGALSSATKVLKGRTLEGKTITAVKKGRGVWRSILFDDGTEMTVEKTYINDLCRAMGTKGKIQEFQAKKGEAKTLQALRSLKYHEARAQRLPRVYTRELHRAYLDRAKEISPALPPDSTFVTYQGKFFSMPKEYAEHLEELGILKIQKTKRDLQYSKPSRRKVKR